MKNKSTVMIILWLLLMTIILVTAWVFPQPFNDEGIHAASFITGVFVSVLSMAIALIAVNKR